MIIRPFSKPSDSEEFPGDLVSGGTENRNVHEDSGATKKLPEERKLRNWALVDSHCHLAYTDPAQSIECKIENADAAGVKYLLSISTSPDDVEETVKIANTYENVFCSVGYHPESCTLDCQDLSRFLENEKVIAIGEVGLDYHYDYPLQAQKNLLISMLELSKISGLPYIIHARECFPDIIDIISDYKNVTGIFHCYTDNLENAKRALDLGFYISFSGVITFKKSDSIREVLRYVPDDRLLIETDAPFMTPEPHRGKTNEPAYVRFVAERVALERNASLEEIASITTNNFFTLFKKAKKA